MANVILIGFRGVGKTTVAKALRQALGWPMIEIDREIQKRIGSISESVNEHGWQYFHDVESQVLEQLIRRMNKLHPAEEIIDCGGGIVLRYDNVRLLKRLGLVVLLEAAEPEIVARLAASHPRPAIEGQQSIAEEVRTVLPKRLDLYHSAADVRIDTTRKTAAEVAAEVIEAAKLRRNCPV